MIGVLVRTTMMLVVAPPAPVSWWPGGRILPDSLLHRLPGVRTRLAAEAIKVLQPSGTRVVGIPVGGDRRRPAVIAAPWGEPVVPFAGVSVSTALVPQSWLRPMTKASTVPAVGDPLDARPTPPVRPSAPRVRRHATANDRAELPAVHARIRRAATLALGLLVSLVAVEAAARTSRR